MGLGALGLGFRVRGFGIGFRARKGINPSILFLITPERRRVYIDGRGKENCNHVFGGSWDLVSIAISTLTGAIVTYKYSYLIHVHNPSY